MCLHMHYEMHAKADEVRDFVIYQNRSMRQSNTPFCHGGGGA